MILTKTYRLVWGDDKHLFMDPCIQYSPNSITKTNSSNYFESDSIEEIEYKIDNWNLIYEKCEDDLEDI
jgi:hypothetical protein